MPIPNTKVFLSSSLTLTGGYRLLTEAPGDLLNTVTGTAVFPWIASIGDQNGDGLTEIITGAPGSDDKAVDAGRVYITFGQAAGGTTTTLGDSLTEIIVDGVRAGDRAGAAVGSISDLNGDGLDEILVGAPGFDRTGVTDMGAAFVLWGTGTPGGIDLGDPAQGTGNGKGYMIRGEAAGDEAGAALASIGDLNGDGLAEVLVGARLNDAGGTDSGAAYVVWGKATDSGVLLSNVAAGTGGFKIIGENSGDEVGTTISAIHDLNGDGLDDILVAAPQNDEGGNHGGAVYVVYGKPTGTAVDLGDVAAGTGGYKIVGTTQEKAGAAMRGIGDINGDGLADIAIGSPGSGGTPGSQNIYVVFGKSTTGNVSLAAVAAGTGGFKIIGEAGQNLDGMSFAASADFNRDGIVDFVLGTPYDEEGGKEAGAVYVIWGGVSTAVDLSLVAQGIGGAKIVGTAGSLTGTSVAAAGDLNGDGTADLIIGSPGTGESVSILYSPASWQPDNNIYGTSGIDIMGAGYGGRLKIGDGNDTVLGLAGNDQITTGLGNDWLEGGAGADAMMGGGGDDTYLVDNLGDTTVELDGEGNDTVIASINWALGDFIERLELAGAARVGTGNGLANELIGTAFNDTLDGAGGADMMSGGVGNDTYYVDDAGDVVDEAAGGGIDTVISSIDLTLGAEVERLTLAGAARIGTGNGLANLITGTAFDDTLDGAAGADTMVGGLGDDTYHVDNAGDVITEAAGAGTDRVIASVDYTLGANVENLELTGAARHGTGNALANMLTGTGFDDTLDGKAGADTMAGGLGDDTYVVDDSGDAVVENDGEGRDTVRASVDYTLGAFVEDLVLTAAGHTGTGNGLNNRLTGSDGNDVLDGGAGKDRMAGGLGDDTYVVDRATDLVTEGVGEGTDHVMSRGSYTLSDNVENLTLLTGGDTGTGNDLDNVLTGSDRADHLIGLGGNDILDGRRGADVMEGGLGDDTYYIDNPNDVVIENAGEGFDLVVVDSDWVLSGNIEAVRLTGTGHTAIGDAGNNRLSGEAGDDTLDGGDGDDIELGSGGDDTLISHSGIDVLAGGEGDDTYIVAGGQVHIEDFLGHDTLDCSEGIEDNYIDLSGGTTSHIENEDCDFGGGGTTSAPLDVQFLQDRTGSFADDIAMVRGLVPQIVSALQAVQTDSRFGESSFVDKPIGGFGAAGEWVYRTELALTSVAADLTATYNAMTTLNGLDAPEAQIEALMQLALRTSEVGFRADSARFVVLFTDAPFHVAGDGAAAGITTPNNGDAILDGTPEGTGEDYPMIAQLKGALEAANIIPIFAIAGGFQSTYQALADQLGRGTVVTLTANSSNVVDAITAGITAATVTIIEDAIGGEGNDTLTGNDAENHLAGNGGDDHLEGGAGDDTADYGRNSGRYSVFHTGADTYTITGKGAAAGDGTDTLTGMEFAKFADGTFALAALAAGVTVTGTTGNDVITPKNSAVGNGDDTLTGLEGND
ncbi:MAG TPA: FG-GAP-like repeat-containing protein, partial [Aestuariivirga sp.]|nr:FG-GAP-like repeat-containing protein [Aestuariivirga sp.]